MSQDKSDNKTEDKTDENDIIANRRSKRARWLDEAGVYPNTFRREALSSELHALAADKDKAALEAEAVSTAVAGRVMLRRVMGKASFITLQDAGGQIQCYIRRDDLGDEAYASFNELWDLGDIVAVSGTLMRTNKGELTVHAQSIELLNKTVRPLPEKYHGLVDLETKYRQRYLDLIMSADSRRIFETRTAVVAAIREFFLRHDFLEVETPMMHVIPGGATARPFITHHNSLDLELYLRVAPELFLKRLVVGGFERVFEINRNFRNEGLSTRHNPEFTMLEFYWAYRDFEDLITFTQDLLSFVADRVLEGNTVTYQGMAIDLAAPAARMTMAEAVVRYTDLEAADVKNQDRLTQALTRLNVPMEAGWGPGKLLTELFEAQVEERLQEPTFITHYPTEVSPLSRRNDQDPDVTDRFELFIGGREIANGFSELNDPDDQAVRFRAQVEAKAQGDAEAMGYDEDYIRALEYGLPPTAGEGLGIDRLVMLLTDSASIRDVLLFPLMRPESGRDG
jgi:lysyl-tRNA synthetase class 2